MMWFLLGLFGFLISWEIMYFIQKKYPSFMFGGFCLYWYEPTWLEIKIDALMNLLIIFGFVSLIGIIFYEANVLGYLLEALIVISAIIEFFIINYLIAKVRK